MLLFVLILRKPHDCFNCCQQAVEVLLTLPSINKNECDEDGLTAADLAKDCGHDECAKFIKNYTSRPAPASVSVP